MSDYGNVFECYGGSITSSINGLPTMLKQMRQRFEQQHFDFCMTIGFFYFIIASVKIIDDLVKVNDVFGI